MCTYINTKPVSIRDRHKHIFAAILNCFCISENVSLKSQKPRMILYTKHRRQRFGTKLKIFITPEFSYNKKEDKLSAIKVSFDNDLMLLNVCKREAL